MRELIEFHGFTIAGINPMTAVSARSYPRHIHDQYGVGIIDAGGQSSWSGRGQVEAGPQTFICVNPGEVHDGHAVGHQPRCWRMVYFDPAVIEQARCDILDGRRSEFTFAVPVFSAPKLQRSFEAMFAHARRTERGAEMAVETSVLTFVAGLVPHSTSKADLAKASGSGASPAFERSGFDEGRGRVQLLRSESLEPMLRASVRCYAASLSGAHRPAAISSKRIQPAIGTLAA